MTVTIIYPPGKVLSRNGLALTRRILIVHDLSDQSDVQTILDALGMGAEVHIK